MRRVRDTSKTQRSVSAEYVAEALSAKDIGAELAAGQGPISLFSLRQAIVGQLRSTGGRPRLEGSDVKRKKIALIKGDWEKIEALAAKSKEPGMKTISAGQIASMLIHNGLSRIDESGNHEPPAEPVV